MIEELFINGSYIELSDTSKIGITFQCNDISNLATRNGDFSNEFSVPKTKNNQIALAFCSGLNSNSNVPYSRNAVRYIQNGIDVVPNGFATVTAYDGGYKIQIVSGNVNIFDLMADRTMNELDFISFEDYWNLTNVVASNSNTDGIIFPIIDYNGMNAANRVVDSRRLLPAVWAKTILSKIFEKIEYTFSGDFLTEEFENLILPLATDNGLSDFFIAINSDQNFTPDTSSFDWNEIGVLDVKTLDLNNNWQYGPPISGTPSVNNTWKFIADVTSDHTFDIGLPYTSTLGLGNPAEIISIAFFHGLNIIHQEDVVAGSSGTLVFSATEYLYVGDRVQISVKTPNQGYNANTITFLVGSYLNIVRKQVSDHTLYASVMPISINLPKIKQSDFIKIICQLYNLSFQTNPFTKNVVFHSFKKISDNIPIAKNWSEKMDVKQAVSIEYTIGNYAQSNIFQYKSDESVNNGVQQHSGVLSVNNENLPISQVIVEFPFAETEMTTKLGGLDVPYINKYNLISDFFDLTTEPRLLYLDKQATLSGVAIKYTDGAFALYESTNIPLCYFVLSGRKNLGWNNNLLENNYQELQSVLTDVKKLTASFKLNATDVSDLDFSIPIFLDVQTPKMQINGYFYLNKITNFMSGQLCKCELIRL